MHCAVTSWAPPCMGPGAKFEFQPKKPLPSGLTGAQRANHARSGGQQQDQQAHGEGRVSLHLFAVDLNFRRDDQQGRPMRCAAEFHGCSTRMGLQDGFITTRLTQQ